MSTKNNPGSYDCYAKAAPDEPMFVLLARDPLAPGLVRAWADQIWKMANSELAQTKALEALKCASAMEQWRLANPKQKP